MKRLPRLAFFLAVVSAPVLWAAVPSPEALDQLVQDYLAKRPSHALIKGFSMEEALQAQHQFVGKLTSTLGKPVGYPLNAVLWLIEDLQRTGEKLRAGDLLSLGSLKAVPPPAGQTITVRYDGLPGGPAQVSVRFR